MKSAQYARTLSSQFLTSSTLCLPSPPSHREKAPICFQVPFMCFQWLDKQTNKQKQNFKTISILSTRRWRRGSGCSPSSTIIHEAARFLEPLFPSLLSTLTHWSRISFFYYCFICCNTQLLFLKDSINSQFCIQTTLSNF